MAINKTTGLTDKQERFCQEYLIDCNATQAAIRAGYSEKTSYSIGEENLRKPEIQKRLEALRKPLAEKVGITQEMVLKEFASIGFANIQDYLEADLSVKDLASIDPDKAKAIGSIEKNVYSNEAGSSVTVKFKMHDKIRALDAIGRHLGFFEKDKDKTPAVHINVTLTDDELARYAKKLEDKF